MESLYRDRASHTNPPGTYFDILSSPNETEEAIEVAILNEHRFAFYYWNKWTNKLLNKNKIIEPPSIVTIDWHNDLASPSEHEILELKKLNKKNNSDVAYFSWYYLNPLNDGHIKTAMYLNVIKDAFVLSKQDIIDLDEDDLIFEDSQKMKHKIFLFKTIEDLENELKKYENGSLYLDIDLDYFMLSKDYCGDDGKLVNEEDINGTLDIQRNFYKIIFNKLKGFTIAREPKCCNGLKNSNYLMDIINEKFFNNTLLTKDAKWNYKY
jgi:hypothetical protein